MLDKLSALWNLFRVGQAVDNPAAWKTGGITVAMLVPVILGIGRVSGSFGFDLPISAEDAGMLAAGILAGVHVVFTVITSRTIGLPAGNGPTSSHDGGGTPG